ncbi:hypothetical protein J6590_055260 [Homalodisca vitripennis]|nr:hypothetical protein J6590_055260 [Homalodisca vitripennis]
MWSETFNRIALDPAERSQSLHHKRARVNLQQKPNETQHLVISRLALQNARKDMTRRGRQGELLKCADGRTMETDSRRHHARHRATGRRPQKSSHGHSRLTKEREKCFILVCQKVRRRCAALIVFDLEKRRWCKGKRGAGGLCGEAGGEPKKGKGIERRQSRSCATVAAAPAEGRLARHGYPPHRHISLVTVTVTVTVYCQCSV